MNILLGNSYWHTRFNIKVWVHYIDRPCLYITKDVRGDFYLAFEGELEAIE